MPTDVAVDYREGMVTPLEFNSSPLPYAELNLGPDLALVIPL